MQARKGVPALSIGLTLFLKGCQRQMSLKCDSWDRVNDRDIVFCSFHFPLP